MTYYCDYLPHTTFLNLNDFQLTGYRTPHPSPKISMFCALSQNYQHLLKKSNTLFGPFRAFNKWQNGEQNSFQLVIVLLILIYTNAKSMVICKPRTLNDGMWRLSSIQKTHKSTASWQQPFCFLSVKLFQRNGFCRLDVLFLDVTSDAPNNCSF